ncbi:ABC transporter ATP-binding protein [Levilinea saccharolytica]|uniref:ABC transporter ATP-binding protein n=1 Tax=Levilinea saccharolytica TaxID=229921 RepID=A0A0P6YHN9_9CHLR|nr:ABC transporter ATP-binding protein [Levilinea saccharolytica]KPL81849.1 ABC transporter ATP-binding protein [Levilinea saccharolytica]GAP17693.1 ABC-type multidrug transport system, ATPase and permease components [Levilinea saccharolytica]
MKGIRRALQYLRKYSLSALGAFLSLLVVNAANLYTPQLLRQVIDDGITSMNMGRIWALAGLLVAVAALRGVFNFLQGYLSEVTSQGIAYELRNAIFDRLQRLSFSYHDQSQTGKLMTRMTSDVELVRMFVGNGLLQLVSAVLLLVGTLVILFSMNALLTGIFLLMIPPILVVFFLFVRGIMPLSKSVQQKLGELNAVLQENLAGIRVVKAFAREDYEQQRFGVRNSEYLGENLKLIRLFSSSFPLIFFIANLGVVGVVWVGGGQVIREMMSLGELVAFVGYQGFFLMPVFMLGFIGSAMSRAEASAQRLFEVMDAELEVKNKPGAQALAAIQGKVSFEGVSFRYAGSEQDVISDISFEAQPNQTVAILGRTGSGKSTIINLIPRFYDVTQGRVCIDGVDVREVTLESLRSQIGIVLQETTLFSGTLRENIAYGRPEASLEEVEEAARAAQVEDFVRELPEGYDTLIGERGVGLSGGQKQRVAIARALLVNPRILIMDDSTSSVDSETEYKIQRALEQLRQGRTTFVIAQRISTVRNADLILLLDQGQLIAQGTHKELMDCCEIYAELLATQFGDQAELEAALEEAVR